MKNKLCVALDVDSGSKAKALVHELKDYVGYFKIGMQLFTSEGPQIVRDINELGGQVFLDLKYHDIPNTVASAAIEAAKLGTSIINVHASGGYEMMNETSRKLGEFCEKNQIKKPIILAVTVLTSINERIMNDDMKVLGPVDAQVTHLARLAKKAGLDGVVSSPLEITNIRAACGSGFIILTPGIRPAWAAANDQKRITTPREAVDSGSDILVLGRPITDNPKPAEAAKLVLEELA